MVRKKETAKGCCKKNANAVRKARNTIVAYKEAEDAFLGEGDPLFADHATWWRESVATYVRVGVPKLV
jgi:hypothetical protein